MSQPNLPNPAEPGTALFSKSIRSEIEVKACWSDIGVYGDSSCLDLQQFVHCRNCPVYSAAGQRLIDRALPADYREEWTRHFAKGRRGSESGSASAILFRIQTEWMALPTHCFQEIAEKRPIHSVPNRPGGVVLGLANVRGELITCISLGHLLQVEHIAPMETVRLDYWRLLVVVSDAFKLAFPVHEVYGPHRFHSQELKNTPAPIAGANPRYAQAVLSWEKRAVGLLDADSLLLNWNRVQA